MNANTDNTPPQAEATKGTAKGKKTNWRLMPNDEIILMISRSILQDMENLERSLRK